MLGQLGNRVQHALRAFTPRDQKLVKAAADSMRPNPELDLPAAITELAVGEALVSLLDASGRPSITERAFIVPPGSQIGPITAEQRRAVLAGSLVTGVYDKTVDRESAYEILKGRAAHSSEQAEQADKLTRIGSTAPSSQTASADQGGLLGGLKDVLFGSTGPRGGHRPGIAESALRSMGTTVGREIVRGVLGSILGSTGSRRRR